MSDGIFVNKQNTASDTGVMSIKSIVTVGTAIAVNVSWDVNHSVLMATLHGFLSWFYVIYYLIVR